MHFRIFASLLLMSTAAFYASCCLAVSSPPGTPDASVSENPFQGKFLVVRANGIPMDVFDDVRVVSLGDSQFLLFPPMVAKEDNKIVAPKWQTLIRLSAIDSIHVFDSNEDAGQFANEHRPRVVVDRADFRLPVREHLPQPADVSLKSLVGKAVVVHRRDEQPGREPRGVTDSMTIHNVGESVLISAGTLHNGHRVWFPSSSVHRLTFFDSISDAREVYGPFPDAHQAARETQTE